MGKISVKVYLLCVFQACLFVSLVSAEGFLREGKPSFSNEIKKDIQQLPKFASLVKHLSPSVVNISVEADKKKTDSTKKASPKFGFEWPLRSVGSGFIISEDGYIVTNFHVIDSATRIIVRLLGDENEYAATIVGVDPKTDLSLLKITAPMPLPAVYLGDSDSLEIGEWVIAIGNQFQLGQTVTAGIVSAKARRLPSKVSGPYDAFIQTDASINPGSSGGPLFNTKGQVVGINTAIFSPGRSPINGSGFNIGIGFSTPINLAKDVIVQLKGKGRVTRGLLGVLIQKMDKDIAKAIGVKEVKGALVADVMDDTPAKQAGFRIKDIIVSFDDQAVNEYEQLPLMVANTPVGKEVSVGVLRGGKNIAIKVLIGELKDVEAEAVEMENPNAFGLILKEITEGLASELDLESPGGLIVYFVEPGSIAVKAGVGKGDIIEELNNKKITDLKSFNNEVKKLPAGQPILMLVKKTEGRRFLTLDMDD